MSAPFRSKPIRRVLSVPLNASGAGTDQIQNVNSAVVWAVEKLAIKSSPTASGCTCAVSFSIGDLDTSYFAGTGDVATGTPEYLEPGEVMTFAFTNGPPNGRGIVTYTFREEALWD